MTTLAELQEKIVPKQPPAPDMTERCDRCGAQAYCRVMKDGVERLLLCAHHGNKHAQGVDHDGFYMLDYSRMLQTKQDEW